MSLTTDKPIHRFCFGLHETRTGVEVIGVVFIDKSKELIPLTIESFTWAAGLVKSGAAKANSINRLSLKHQKLWAELQKKEG